MRKPLFILLLIFTNIGFLFLQIHKTSQFMKQSYRKQHNEQVKNDLLQKKQNLSQRLCAIKNHTTIKQYAIRNLGMEKIKIAQIKKLNSNEEQL